MACIGNLRRTEFEAAESEFRRGGPMRDNCCYRASNFGGLAMDLEASACA